MYNGKEYLHLLRVRPADQYRGIYGKEETRKVILPSAASDHPGPGLPDPGAYHEASVPCEGAAVQRAGGPALSDPHESPDCL